MTATAVDVLTLEGWHQGEPYRLLKTREWLVTNGLGGYASGTIAGECTRRYHGKLVAALPAPLGRVVVLNHLEETLLFEDGTTAGLGGHEIQDDMPADVAFLKRFHLEVGLPVWTYASSEFEIEKRLVMAAGQNTTAIIYRVIRTARPLVLSLRPSIHARGHEVPVSGKAPRGRVTRVEHGLEIETVTDLPPLRISVDGAAELEKDERMRTLEYQIELARGYDYEGTLWSPGEIRIPLERESGVMFSTESWETVNSVSARQVLEDELQRRSKLLGLAGGGDGVKAHLVLAADQFVISPRTRSGDEARARAKGSVAATIIAGYHWFTDWGRDTMISLEGLTLSTGREREAGAVLRTFAQHVRDGLIPNMFPEGENEGLYHTADATMWFFHALARYYRRTRDRATVESLLPTMQEIIEQHLRGTRFGIGVDPEDGLLRQGEEGYQLTWMDAKVDGWVVTPRRGKAVEINALYYNALRHLESWLRELGHGGDAERIASIAERTSESFNRRFWNEDARYLYDVIDGESGNADDALRPNQIFAVSLDYPVLDPSRWGRVVEVVRDHLLTPVGLRSLAAGHPDYKETYHGDLRTRDAAYHQGTVWGWLIGPFFDAYRRVHPERTEEAARLLDGLVEHLGAACVGSASEIFDAEAPFTPRGCVAQAWTVAEMLRCFESLDRPPVHPQQG